jgi:hypothetical protein
MNANAAEFVPKAKRLSADAPVYDPVEAQAEKTSKEVAEKVLEGEGGRRKTRKGKKSRKTLKKTQSRRRRRGGSSCSGM